jgi:hypothetical protein
MEFLPQIVERLLRITTPRPPVILAPDTSLFKLPEYIPDADADKTAGEITAEAARKTVEKHQASLRSPHA